MSVFTDLLLKIRKAETPLYARLKRFIRAALVFEMPSPRWLHPFWHFVNHVRWMTPFLLQKLCVVLYRKPIFRSQCAQAGKRLYLEQIPSLYGKVKLVVGDDVNISGAFFIGAGRTLPQAEVILGNKVFIGHPVTMQVAQRIELMEGAALAGGCYVTDNDAHPLDIESRLRGDPVSPDEIQPVRLGRYAWVGRGSYVMKGVTIGDFAIVGVGSVVVSDIPPFSIAMGNPARVVKRLPIPEGWEPSGNQPAQ